VEIGALNPTWCLGTIDQPRRNEMEEREGFHHRKEVYGVMSVFTAVCVFPNNVCACSRIIVKSDTEATGLSGHYPSSLKQRFGDWTLPSSSGEKHTQLGPIVRASPHLKTPEPAQGRTTTPICVCSEKNLKYYMHKAYHLWPCIM
jgi:hypothetical protein